MANRGTRILRFATSDPDEFAETLRPIAPSGGIQVHATGPFRADVSAARLDHLGLLTIQAEGLHVGDSRRGHTSVNIPVHGQFSIRSGWSVSEHHGGNAFVLRGEDPFELRAPGRSSVLVGMFDDELLAEHADGDRASAPSRSGSSEALLEPRAAASLRRHLELLWSEICCGASWLEDPRVVREAQAMLAALFVHAVEQRTAAREPADAGFCAVRRATGYIEANLADVITRADVAAETSMSSRSLERAFKRYVGVAPMKYIRERRLHAACRDLRAADPGQTTVTKVAYRYGFAHLGRFASAYRAEFGESPSDTLRRDASPKRNSAV